MLFPQMADVLVQPALVHGAELLQQDDRRKLQTVLRVNKVVRRQLGLDAHLAGNGGNDDRGAVPVSDIVLNDNDRAIALLLGADPATEIRVI